MDIAILLFSIITFICFLQWINTESNGADCFIFLGIVLVLLGQTAHLPLTRFTVESKTVTDCYNGIYFQHPVTVYSVEAYKRGCCLVSSRKLVIVDDPNQNPSTEEVIARISERKVCQ